MRTIVLNQPGQLQRREDAEPGPPPPGHAAVAVRRIGVCGTDLHAYRGRQPFFTYPRVLGHELGVEVVAVADDVTAVAPCDRCAVEPYLHCGRCIACRRDRPNCCVRLAVLGVHVDGGMRETIHVPAGKLHRSTKLSLDQLALVETLGIGAHAVDRGQLQQGETVLVIGAGPIGLAVMQFALAAGARVIAMDTNAPRLAFCRGTLGVAETIDAGADDVLARLASLTDADLPTAVFDATGNPASMAAAFDYPAAGGRLVLVGLFQGDLSFHDPAFHRRELTLLASRNARPGDFARIIGMIESGRLDTTPWITHRCPFDETVAQFPTWAGGQTPVIKAMIEL